MMVTESSTMSASAHSEDRKENSFLSRARPITRLSQHNMVLSSCYVTSKQTGVSVNKNKNKNSDENTVVQDWAEQRCDCFSQVKSEAERSERREWGGRVYRTDNHLSLIGLNITLQSGCSRERERGSSTSSSYLNLFPGFRFLDFFCTILTFKLIDKYIDNTWSMERRIPKIPTKNINEI